MKETYDFWIKKWQKSKNFQVENDRMKTKSYLFSSFPKINTNGFQTGNVRHIIANDILAKYQRMTGNNVLFPIGYDSLGLASFLQNKKRSNIINNEINEVFKNQLLNLGIGIDNTKELDLKSNEYLAALQLAFIELYERGYIKYDYIDVLLDRKKNKIFDNYYQNAALVPNRIKGFYLDIEDLIEPILKEIDVLEIEESIKRKLIEMLEPKKSLTIPFAVTNGNTININLKEPQFIGGISFIAINPDLIDFSLYTAYEEYGAIEKYLSEDSTNDFGVFSGTYAVNPLTGKKIPIFISLRYDSDIYVANPYLNGDDRQVALEECLPVIDVVQNGVFIESDFLNGLPIEKGKETIIENFVEAFNISTDEYYSREKILLSSSDAYGALIPFFKDNEDIYSLKNYLPLAFSTKFRPILSEDIDVPGALIEGSINHIFSSGMVPFLALLYDDIGSTISLFSREAKNLFKDWQKLNLLAVSKEELFENVFFPCCINAILKKENQIGFNKLFSNIKLVNDVFDEKYLPIKKANNNLMNFDYYLTNYGGDALRMYFTSKPLAEDFIFSENELASLSNLIKGIEEFMLKPLVFENSLDLLFKDLVEECSKLLDAKSLVDYVNTIISFYKNCLWKENITQKQSKLFLTLIYPLLPFLAEDLYLRLYNSRYLISDNDWPIYI